MEINQEDIDRTTIDDWLKKDGTLDPFKNAGEHKSHIRSLSKETSKTKTKNPTEKSRTEKRIITENSAEESNNRENKSNLVVKTCQIIVIT